MRRSDGAASAAGLESSEALQRSVANAWQAARTEQQQQIQRLKRQLEAAVALEREAPPEEERSFGETMAATTLRLEESERMRRERPGVTELWQLAENRTAGSTTERRARSRALTRATFKFLSELTAYDEDEAQRGDEAKVALPGEGLISVSGSRQRLRLLERHEAASCVEYRLFAASLAADDAFAEASGASLLVDELDANGNIIVVSRWFDGTLERTTRSGTRHSATRLPRSRRSSAPRTSRSRRGSSLSRSCSAAPPSSTSRPEISSTSTRSQSA